MYMYTYTDIMNERSRKKKTNNKTQPRTLVISVHGRRTNIGPC